MDSQPEHRPEVQEVSFMELRKENIHRLGSQGAGDAGGVTMQLTLDDDFNVPDSKPDAGGIIREHGEIRIREKKFSAGRLHVKGVLEVGILYLSEDKSQAVCGMEGELPFDEMIHMDQQDATSPVRLVMEVEDINVSLVHSRKLNVKALVTLRAVCEELQDEVVVTEAEGSGIFARAKDVTFTNLAMQQKDTFRMREEVSLPASKPNMQELVYRELVLRMPESRITENQLTVDGVAELFVVYRSAGAEEGLETWETELAFHGQFELPGAREDMIEDISYSISHESISMKPDEDGEERILEAEAVIELDMKLYEEKELTVLEDIYSLHGNVELNGAEAGMNRLLVKNQSKARFTGKMSLTEGKETPLQICHGSAAVHMESKKLEENAILVEGLLELKLLYITGSDDCPMAGVKEFAPFSHRIEVDGITEDCSYQIVPSVTAVSFQLFRSEEAEWKVEVSMQTMAFCRETEHVITDASFVPFTKEEQDGRYSMVGYLSEEGDTLWSIGKEFHMPPEEIAAINELTGEEIPERTMLLLVKNTELTED